MYFCPNCNNVFDIKKVGQTGGGKANGDFADVIKKIIANKALNDDELSALPFDDVVKSDAYEKLKPKQKELVINRLQDALPIDKKKFAQQSTPKANIGKVCFVCNNCGFTKPIEGRTLVFSKVSNDISQSYSTSDYKEMGYSDILPRTRKYVCPNPKCISHTDLEKREASFFRTNNTFKIKYNCHACGIVF